MSSGRAAGPLGYHRDIASGISTTSSPKPVRLLLKAIRSLPERDQEAVLGYLLERSLLSSPGASGPRAPELPLPSPAAASGTPRLVAPAPYYEAAAGALRRLAGGGSLTEVAMEPGFEELAAALRDLAARSQTPARLAAVLRMLADGESVARISSELGCSAAEIAAELEPSQSLAAALAAALLARSVAVPLQLGTGGQGNLRTMPVRFPEAQYQRLKEWSTEHNFPMAVVVRGLVERFLDGQQRPAA